MKLLVSSKRLHGALSKFDFDTDCIVRVNLEDSELLLISNKQTEKVWLDIIEFKPSLAQDGPRWDWVRQLMSGITEQPVVLNISEKKVEVVFQY